MIQKAQRRANGERVQPQRHLRQLHRHPVQVNAVNAALHHRPLQKLRVVQPRRVDGNVLRRHVVQNGAANIFELRQHRVMVGMLVQNLDQSVGEVIHRFHQKVAAAHRRVADFDIQQRFAGLLFQPV